MDVASFGYLLEMVTPLIVKQNTLLREAISPDRRLMATLRYLVSGGTLEKLKFPTGIAPQTLGKIVEETCDAIVQVLKGVIQTPATEEEWKNVAVHFERRWSFPHCIGAVDGKHILIRKPLGSGSYYYNYQKSFSVVLMGVVDANYEFIMVDVGTNGRVSDAGAISKTEFYKRLVNKELHIPEPDSLPSCDMTQPYVFAGDEAFPLLDNLMIPFSEDGITKEQEIFNYRLARPRRIAANTFSVLASRYRILSQEICLSPEKAILIILTCVHLHNFLRRKRDEFYNKGGYEVENPNTGVISYADWATEPPLLPLQPIPSLNVPESAEQVRRNFLDYFNSVQGAEYGQYGLLKNHGSGKKMQK
uniref:Putative nuclease harbi1 n=1 Tax=Anopheles triannulatus TaxID=58253 RepID=A0A2M4AT59_9DIPT